MSVIWKSISGFGSKYVVGNDGSIKKLRHEYINRWGGVSVRAEKYVTQARDKDGYLRLALLNKGKAKYFYAHRLVAQCFIGNDKGKPCVNHKNSDRDDNRVENLEWVTPKENVWHGILHGNDSRKGQDNGNSKLSELRVSRIKRLLKHGKDRYTVSYISDAFNIPPSTVSHIKTGLTWGHIIV